MSAFAANSILCRLALADSVNDPMSFTIVRLFSGALALSWVFFKNKKKDMQTRSWKTLLGPTMLFSYALFFSISYVQISAGAGALILFTSVQITMMSVAFLHGIQLSFKEKVGYFLAMMGFIYLVLPGLHMPSFFSAIMMSLAGISWGLYSILGQGTVNPSYSTARNFIFTLPLLVVIFVFRPIQLSENGFIFASLSGGITSGLGYMLWYSVLSQIKTSTAAIIQLSVPILAGLGGVIFLGEMPSQQLMVASLFIFTGILLKTSAKKKLLR